MERCGEFDTIRHFVARRRGAELTRHATERLGINQPPPWSADQASTTRVLNGQLLRRRPRRRANGAGSTWHQDAKAHVGSSAPPFGKHRRTDARGGQLWYRSGIDCPFSSAVPQRTLRAGFSEACPIVRWSWRSVSAGAVAAGRNGQHHGVSYARSLSDAQRTHHCLLAEERTVVALRQYADLLAQNTRLRVPEAAAPNGILLRPARAGMLMPSCGGVRGRGNPGRQPVLNPPRISQPGSLTAGRHPFARHRRQRGEQMADRVPRHQGRRQPTHPLACIGLGELRGRATVSRVGRKAPRVSCLPNRPRRRPRYRIVSPPSQVLPPPPHPAISTSSRIQSRCLHHPAHRASALLRASFPPSALKQIVNISTSRNVSRETSAFARRAPRASTTALSS